MKTVFSNTSEVVHVFAQRTQSEGRNSSRSIFFNQNRIYSYGYHYLLAEFIEGKKGETAILINDTGYSVTTSKHISEVRQATRQYKQFFETKVSASKVAIQLNQLSDKLAKARKPEIYLSEIQSLIASFKEFAQFEGINLNSKKRICKDTNYILKLEKKISTNLEQYKEQIKKAQEKAKKAKERKAKQQAKEFYSYEIDSFRSEFESLRISKDGQFIETSQNVKVDIKEARLLFHAITEGKPVHGQKIGYYTIKGYANNVLTVGCHKIKKYEIFRIGKQL